MNSGTQIKDPDHAKTRGPKHKGKFIGSFPKYAVGGCKQCSHPEQNPHGHCSYADAKVYMSNDGRKKMVKGTCNKTGRRSTVFMSHDPTFLKPQQQ